MSSFTVFAKTPCETLQKLRSKGITQNSAYIQDLEAACSQKMQSKKTLSSQTNRVKIVGISALILILTTVLYLKTKK